MQWDKVKNVLIGILLAVNLFLLGNLGFRALAKLRRASGLDADLRALVSGCGSTLADSFRLPEDVFLPELNLDRSRADEENAASVMLGADMERTGAGGRHRPLSERGRHRDLVRRRPCERRMPDSRRNAGRRDRRHSRGAQVLF